LARSDFFERMAAQYLFRAMRMKLLAALGLGIFVSFATAVAVADSPSDKSASQSESRASDLAAIRQASRDFEKAFNSGEAAEVAACWTEDGDYQSETGEVFAGRQAIEAEYQGIFAARQGQQLKIVIDSLRLLSDAAAIEDGRALLEPAPAGAPAIGKYTAVHVKVDGRWLMSTVRETRVETPSGHAKVADLEWLIGTWIAEDQGTRTESVCRWVANKSFVQRTYTVTHPDQSTTSGLQLIGFNPHSGHVQSWNFTSDGGHAVGVWSPREKGWSAEIRGTLPDGTLTTAINLLTKLDDNAYVWQSVQRTVGDHSLPDTDEVVLKRQANK
jgi:uncharacterized protein (TIGR02246 family)